MSPTVFRVDGLRFFVFSREESRRHVHVEGADGEAKFWIEPEVTLARSVGMKPRDLQRAERIIKERIDEIRSAWDQRPDS